MALSTPVHLPHELWSDVFRLLDVQDIKSVRRTCEAWAGVGSRYLFSPFIFKADRKDFERFDKIAKRNEFIAGIDSITWQNGTMDIYHMAQRLGQEYRRLYDNTRKFPPHGTYTKSQLEEERTSAAVEYAAWNVRLHKAAQRYDKVHFINVFNKLKNLKRIDVARKTTAFNNDLLLEGWFQGSGNCAFEVVVKECIALLKALDAMPFRLSHFSHDQLPTTFFHLPSHQLQQYILPLVNLETLHLTFDATIYPHSEFWKGLGEVLRSLPDLKDLRFGFAPLMSSRIDCGNWFDTTDPRLYYIPLWELLGNYTWPRLRRLRMDGMMMCETGLTQLLQRHAPTLRILELFQIGLWYGSFKVLLTNLRDILTLDAFRMWGILRAHHVRSEAWRIRPKFMGQSDTWNAVGGVKHSLLSSSSHLFERLEAFVKGQIDWPVKASDTMIAILKRQWLNSFHSEECELDCRLLNHILGHEDDLSSDEWEIAQTPSSVVDTEWEEQIEWYDENGWDEFGFDREGNNAEGEFHRDVQTVWLGTDNSLVHGTAHRDTLRCIIEEIPRFWEC